MFLEYRQVLQTILPDLSKTLKETRLSSSLVNLFVNSILRHPDGFSDVSFCKLIFDDFLLAWVQWEDVLHHIVRLLWCVYEKIDSQLLVGLLTSTQPSQQVYIYWIMMMFTLMIESIFIVFLADDRGFYWEG